MTRFAPGQPGIPPRWTSSEKAGVGTALTALSRVWFTISHGILNEVYYPRVDQACIRDLGLMVSDGADYFSEEKRDCHHRVFTLEDGVPAYRLMNTAVDGRYRIIKRVLTDPKRDVVLQSIRFETLAGPPLRLFALLAPHLVNGGAHNTGWVGEYKGQQMLFAEGDGTCLAMAASVPWRARSAGFVGVSDGWRQLSTTGTLDSGYDRAEDGNIALCGEFDLGAGGKDEILLVLGFGRTCTEAALRARLSLAQGYREAAQDYMAAWRAWQETLLPFDRVAANGRNTYRISTAVLRTHESPSFPGGLIASLSIPWGFSRGDDDLGGYHLVWARDLVQTAGALIACGAGQEAQRVLEYLRAIQEPDGHWPQNSWLDGVSYWHGVQLDECAFPILLIDLARRNGVLTRDHLPSFWPMVRAAAGFVMRHGPITGQDRWEEDSGLSPFTLAVAIAALLVAAELADMLESPRDAALMRDTADAWNDRIEAWTFARGTDLARRVGVDGYYVRIAPPDGVDGEMEVKNRPEDDRFHAAATIVSPDALALVRFGLRAADDPRIRATLRVIDATLKAELPAGPCWYRYTDDGYGEHADGSPFDGTGTGRPWPLLCGERAHYEIAAGNIAGAESLLTTMEALTSRGGLLPEQVWDADDIPARELVRGAPSGSAMPLVWAHSEHIKLVRSLTEERVFDRPPQPVQRYLHDRVPPRCAIWRKDLPVASVTAGRVLRLDLPDAAVVRWTADGWHSFTDSETTDTGLDLHILELPASAPGTALIFTWRRLSDGAWDGQNYTVTITAAETTAAAWDMAAGS
jgi:glucoamylase